MNSAKYLIIVLFCILIVTTEGWGSQPQLDIVQFKLANGMKVVLKPTNFDSDMILVRVSAKGGYAALPIEQRAAAELSAAIVLESGFGEVTSDKLFAEEIEFDIKVLPYCRFMEGSAEPDELSSLLDYIRLAFTEPGFCPKAFETVIQRETRVLQQADRDKNFQRAYMAANTQNFSWLLPLTGQDLKRANLSSAQQHFHAFFDDPADFTFVMVGNFDVKAMQAELEKKVGQMKPRKLKLDYSCSSTPPCPKGKIEKEVIGQGRKDSQARLTFHLDDSLDARNLPALKIICEWLESRVRQNLKEKFQSDQGIDASCQIPIYPRIDLPWIVIQYRSDPQNLIQVKNMILDEINKMMDKGIKSEELIQVKNGMKSKDEFWLRDNQYWLSTLSNYSLWGWELNELNDSWEQLSKVEVAQMNKVIRMIHQNDYTFVYTKPEK
jgi:predicted Zn-dependent peptidase